MIKIKHIIIFHNPHFSLIIHISFHNIVVGKHQLLTILSFNDYSKFLLNECNKQKMSWHLWMGLGLVPRPLCTIHPKNPGSCDIGVSR